MKDSDNMSPSLEPITKRLYQSVAEIKSDQEKVVATVFDQNPDFAYLKEDNNLSTRVRTKSLAGLRESVTKFMEQRSITDMRDVFEHPHFSEFYHTEDKYSGIAKKLTSDTNILTRLCNTEEESVYECEHIAEEIASTYVNYILEKGLTQAKKTSPATFDNIDMPDKPDSFD